MLYREIIAVCSQIHTKHINTLCGQNVEFLSVLAGGKQSDVWALKNYDVGWTKLAQVVQWRLLVSTVRSQVHVQLDAPCNQIDSVWRHATQPL